ncbi:MAG: ACT domain-containing protein [bacterium]
MKVNQLSVFVENQPGRLAGVARALGENDINIMAMTIAETKEFGVLRMIVADYEKGMQVLKDAGYTVVTTEILAIEVQDKPGALARVLEAFAGKNLNVEYMYAFVARRGDAAILVFRFDDPDRAVDALKDSEVRVLTNEEVISLEK